METSESILCKFTFPFFLLEFGLLTYCFLKQISSHLHGPKFMIVGRSEDYTSTDPALNPPIVEGRPNPIRRDTVQIGGSSATLRIVADNPGLWLFHCKSSLHL
jgi:hypothetical protein